MIVNGWLDWAVRYPDPTPSQNAGVNPVSGIVLHSAEGYKGGLISVINDNKVSWHFSNLFDGTLWQHYPITAKCWHSGSAFGNENLIGIEHEGRGHPSVPFEPLTDAQIATTRRIIAEITAEKGWIPVRGITMFEHKEVGQTSCPNGRIPWDRILAEEGTGEMINHSAVASFFSGKRYENDGAIHTMNARTDFQLPATAKRVRIGVYLSNGNEQGSGYLRYFNGNDGTEAEPIGWGEKPIFATADVALDGNGHCTFKAEGGYFETALVRSLGYWLA